MSSYRHIRNETNKLISELKKQYYSERISQAKDNIEESWRTINQVTNKPSKTTKIDMFKESGSDLVNKQDIANTMNHYFCSVGKT